MQRSLMWTLKQLNLSLEQYGREQLEALGISPTQGITLHYLLSRKNQAVYAVNLHEALGLSKSAVSATLKALKQKGYLTMAVNPNDDRKKQIILTDKAYEMEDKLNASLQEQQERLCNTISEQRLKQLKADMEIMLLNLTLEDARNESAR